MRNRNNIKLGNECNRQATPRAQTTMKHSHRLPLPFGATPPRQRTRTRGSHDNFLPSSPSSTAPTPFPVPYVFCQTGKKTEHLPTPPLSNHFPHSWWIPRLNLCHTPPPPALLNMLSNNCFSFLKISSSRLCLSLTLANDTQRSTKLAVTSLKSSSSF